MYMYVQNYQEFGSMTLATTYMYIHVHIHIHDSLVLLAEGVKHPFVNLTLGPGKDLIRGFNRQIIR